jgi:anti-sigma factor RsiW
VSDPKPAIHQRAEFLDLLPAYVNGLLGQADSHRMEHALQQYPEWRHDVVFDQMWKEALQSHMPELDMQQEWLVFERRLEIAGLIDTKLDNNLDIKQHDN